MKPRIGAHSGAAGQAKVPAVWRPPGALLCPNLTALLRRHSVEPCLCSSLLSGCKVAEEEASRTAMTGINADESGARPGPLSGGKAPGLAGKKAAEGADGAGYGGVGVWHRCRSQSRG